MGTPQAGRHSHVTGGRLHCRIKAKSPAALPSRITAWNADVTEKKNLMFTVSKTSVGSDLFSSSAEAVVINRTVRVLWE